MLEKIGHAPMEFELRIDEIVKNPRSLHVELLGAREAVSFCQTLRNVDQRNSDEFGLRLRVEFDAVTFEHATLSLEVKWLGIDQQAVDVKANRLESSQD